MVYITRAINGNRTVQFNTNTRKSMIDELKESLEGLVFKIEIKIAGISKAEQPNGKIEASVSKIETETAAKPELSIPKVEPKLPKLDQSIHKAEPSVPRVESSLPKVEPSVPKVEPNIHRLEQPIVQRDEPPKIDHIINDPSTSMLKNVETYVPKPVETNISSEERSESPIRKRLGRPMVVAPKIIKGSLTIGQVVISPIIAVDSKQTPPAAYIPYENAKLFQTVDYISRISTDIEDQPKLTSINVGDIVFARSADDNEWYRAIVESVEGNTVNVYFFDWGLRESLSLSRLRYLLSTELGLAKLPACAIKIELEASSPDLIEDAMKMEEHFKLYIKSYDDISETYKVMILGRK